MKFKHPQQAFASATRGANNHHYGAKKWARNVDSFGDEASKAFASAIAEMHIACEAAYVLCVQRMVDTGLVT